MGARHDRDDDPHPQTLVRRLLEQGDPGAALEVCAIWRARDPSDPRIADLEADARIGAPGVAPGDPFDITEAETYVQNGFLHEGLFIYRRLVADPGHGADPEIVQRTDLLTEVLAFSLPAGADQRLEAAEEQVRQGHLPMALLAYHEIVQGGSAGEAIVRRRDQLRSLLVDVPSSAVRDDITALSDTITESVEHSLPLPRGHRRRFPARTERIPSIVDAFEGASDPEPAPPPRRVGLETEIDYPLQAARSVAEAVEAARAGDADRPAGASHDSVLPSPTAEAETYIPVPEPLIAPHEKHPSSVPGAIPAAPVVEPLVQGAEESPDPSFIIENGPPPRDSMPPAVAEVASSSWLEPTPVEPSHTSWLEPIIDDPPPVEGAEPRTAQDHGAPDEGSAEPFSPEWLAEVEQKSQRRRRGPRTEPGMSPMVVSRDESGHSMVEVPRNIPSVMERIKGRMTVTDAAVHAEPFGVIVRSITIIE